MLVNSNLTLPARQVEVWFLLINTGNVGQLESSSSCSAGRVRFSLINTENVGQLESSSSCSAGRVRFLLINTVDGDEVSSVRLAGPATQSSF